MAIQHQFSLYSSLPVCDHTTAAHINTAPTSSSLHGHFFNSSCTFRLCPNVQAEGHLDSAKSHAGKAASEFGKAAKAGASDAKGRAALTAEDAKSSSKSAASSAKVRRSIVAWCVTCVMCEAACYQLRRSLSVATCSIICIHSLPSHVLACPHMC